ncbi:MAG: hypothetical protein IT159_01720 [Bryobacterales bacterium]|nr:hypothetical protein [Bryobacterales bacterium]
MLKRLLLLAPAVAWAWSAPGAGPAAKSAAPHFRTSDRCLACHNGLTGPSGEDISVGFDWRPGMMANAARDPYWMAGVRREITDHPSARAVIEDECSICHMPMARYLSKLAGHEGALFANLPPAPGMPGNPVATDGVSCSLCHQISQQKLGTRESYVGGFVIEQPGSAGDSRAYGPFTVDAGRARVMRSSSGFTPTESKHIRQSEVCATCHTLFTHALGPQGEAVGELPEQTPYLEWLASDFKATRSCQNCHMPRVGAPVHISSVLGQPREDVSRHEFLGGNFFMQRLLNRYRNELGVIALPQELESGAVRTLKHLETEAARISIASIEVQAGRLEAEISVENLSGHKLPTAYPSRRVWLHVTVMDRDGKVLFESGAVDARGAIAGNDNDVDGSRYEPHYDRIDSAGQVQIYETVMADSAGALTTGLLRGVRYIKDNRLLPRGFDKRSAGRDVAVEGAAAADGNFTGGGDRVRYSVDVSGAQGPYRLEAELRYQSIAFRWAANLRQYDSAETQRFVRYYDASSAGAVATLARARAVR